VSKFNIYDHITELFVKSLEKGVVPWQKTWRTGMPRSLRQEYRGVNRFMLLLVAEDREYVSNLWLTWNDVQRLGGKVKPHSRSALVTYFKVLQFAGQEEDDDPRRVPMLRYYKVFNADVVERLPITTVPTPVEEHQAAGDILKGYRNAPRVLHRMSANPRYRPGPDVMELPPAGQFNDVPAYWQTMFHELVHSTGHSSRLKRWTEGYDHAFGSEDYSKEELIAELGSAFLMNRVGLESETTHENSAAYLGSWLRVLKADNRFVYQAASKAQRAVDYIRGETDPARETPRV